MKKNFIVALCVLSAMAMGVSGAYAQFPEDVARYSWPGTGVGGRAMGMGNASMSFVDDYSAVFLNPAGLAQSKMNEFSFGLSHLSYGNSTLFMGTETSFSNNQTSLNHIGLVYAVPTRRGSFSIGIGYDRSSEFTTGLSFEGFNPMSSIVQSWAPDGQPYPADYLTRAEVLELARVDTINGVFISPITDSVLQSGKTLEGGGLNHFALSGAAEVARNLYIGVSLNFISGSYSYSGNFMESDNGRRYETFPFDYEGLDLFDLIEAELSGFNINAGMIYRFSEYARFGLTVKTPSWITVEENFSSDATSYFDNGDFRSDPADGDPGSFTEYDISTPFVFSTGLSGGTPDFTVAGSVEYTDYTQMEFRNATTELLGYNTTIKEIYRPTVNLRVGGEVRIPDTDLFLRAGYMYLPSPYDGDPSSFDRKYITGGAGFRVDRSVSVDIAYAHGSWETYRQIYSGVNTDLEAVTTHNLKGTVSFLF
jgi:long-subunit fatty acid transport protein